MSRVQNHPFMPVRVAENIHKGRAMKYVRAALGIVAVLGLFFQAGGAWAGENELRQWRDLYIKLMFFSGEPRFIRYGFAPGHDYAQWLDNVKAMEANAEAKKTLEQATGYKPSALVELAEGMIINNGWPDEEGEVLVRAFEKGLEVYPRNYAPSAEVRALEGHFVTDEIAKKFGPIRPEMEGEDYWDMYLEKADVTMVVRDGVINRTLKGRRGAEHIRVRRKK